jgi:glycosyltransferase involved in cell wall biosynthesis
MVDSLGSQWMGLICFAGEAPDKSLMCYADSLGLRKRIVSIVKPNHETLVSLYNKCFAFIFPSFSEGFGWPLIEAQACGTPVIATHIEPLPEVGGDGALYADPYKPQEFAKAFLMLRDNDFRFELIERGLENSKRFEVEKMIQAYLELHGIKQLTLA